MTHIPVLQKEVIDYLDPKPNENFIDATIGEGGHTAAILEKNKPNGKVLGIEIDPEILEKFKFQDRLILVNDSYVNLKNIIEKYNFGPIKGILFDLGMSSWHLEESGRGFSFQKDEPLDMRYDESLKFKVQSSKLTAEEILNKWRGEELEKILREYGQERFAQGIAKKIIETRRIRPIKTTFQLVEIIKRATPSWYHHQRKHFATKTFQALRITVNNELENIKKGLEEALDVLGDGGRLVVISFHSLEDRIVKNFFSTFAKDYEGQERKIEILTKKPIRPSLEEIKTNKRSRSAKLRAARRGR
ncbi:16S rRNA (cytosine(1402)-N(4))-methyltransferase [bacterium (Candidatus Gribaldobacteria) CG_4_10_14_0_2_um_filter_36_18]|uniref:Ribosomal RNA small subunit methyltransferase H n=2 Tax=Candidatus Gribaldobacteria TaxID=2798536 RepID=A0A2M7VKW4_9BACT|nr:MAG: 16S rRNA (cytosine(1402)-N(4))-methyltransferase [bacterium (Candidatus Gribaldobacteria) CG_4_10_14_0_2_um_filter_36_18]